MARAAWVGMFATALNLLPIGQLDGGHILYSFFPAAAQAGLDGVCASRCCRWESSGRLVLLGRSLLLLLGRRHPSIYDAADLGAGRRKLAWLALVVFLLCFTFAPVVDRRACKSRA